MQLGILGLAKAGKTTLFNLLTGSTEPTEKFAHSDRTHVAVARVPDARLARLRELFQPKLYTPATVEYVDIPGIERGDGSGNLDLAELRNMDALVLVVRAFSDPELIHPDGSIDARRDFENVELELILADHEILGRRIGRLEQGKKRGLKPAEQKELALLTNRLLPALEAEQPIRDLELDADEELSLRGFRLLTAKPLLVVLNVGEDDLQVATAASLGLEGRPGVGVVVMSAPIEAEISQLPEGEQSEFLAAIGLEEPSLDRILRTSYALLGYVSFFTVGDDEVRAWTIRSGTRAREAGGAIHSDIERGFIRAEVVDWQQLLDCGSLAEARKVGSLRLEGKEYLVRDGEVVHFRFNV